jgi:hypothetical protein
MPHVPNAYMESEMRCNALRLALTLEIGKADPALTFAEVFMVLTGMVDRYAQHLRQTEISTPDPDEDDEDDE